MLTAKMFTCSIVMGIIGTDLAVQDYSDAELRVVGIRPQLAGAAPL